MDRSPHPGSLGFASSLHGDEPSLASLRPPAALVVEDVRFISLVAAPPRFAAKFGLQQPLKPHPSPPPQRRRRCRRALDSAANPSHARSSSSNPSRGHE